MSKIEQEQGYKSFFKIKSAQTKIYNFSLSKAIGNVFKKLFQQTFIYGLATVLPRMLSFLLTPLYTQVLDTTAEYGEISVIFSYMIIFNVLLAYGMETAFFRFFHKRENKAGVISTSSISLIGSSILFLGLAFLLQNQIALLTEISVRYIRFVIWILFFDALVIIPFAWLRAQERPMKYALIKIVNVAINLGLNVFFLVFLEDLAATSSFFQELYVPHNEVAYVFIANLIASFVTLLWMAPFYFKLKFDFDKALWNKMLRYAFPVLIAGLAFAVNTAFDKIMLYKMLPESVAKAQVGMYAACYKIALFMTLFGTAFRLGIEPFFFSHAEHKDARKTYADITKYFCIFGSLILIAVIVFADVLKVLIIRDSSYWEAMAIVPLILLANLFLGIYYNLSVWYKITDRTKYGAYISTIGAIVTIVVNLILIPILGFMGAAISTVGAYGVMALLSYWYGQKYYAIPYNLKKILGYIGLSVGFSALSFYGFRGNYFVGIALLLVFIAVIYAGEKKQLKGIIKN